jgi:hypothetical protein
MLADGIESVDAVDDGAQFDCYATSYVVFNGTISLVGYDIIG